MISDRRLVVVERVLVLVGDGHVALPRHLLAPARASEGPDLAQPLAAGEGVALRLQHGLVTSAPGSVTFFLRRPPSPARPPCPDTDTPPASA